MSAVSRRTALAVGGAAVGTGALAAGAFAAGNLAGDAGSGASQTDDILRVGYLPITDAAPLLLAHNQGFYKDQGITVEKPTLLRSWASVAEAFIAGKVDVIHLLMPMAVYLKYELGADAKVIAWNHVNGSALTVAPSITQTAQLAGKTVAIPAWFSIHNILVQKLLRNEGLTPVIRRAAKAENNEVQLIVMAPADMIPALTAGTIAGYTVADPFNAAAVATKVGRIHRFMGDIWRDHACCVTVVRESLITEKPELAQRLTNALVNAQIFAREHRAEAAAILAQNYLPQKPKAIERAMTDHFQDHKDVIEHPSWGGQLLDFLPFPYESFTQELVTEMKSTLVDAQTGFLENLDPASVHEQLVNNSLVEQSIAEAGGFSAFGQAGTTRTEDVQP